MEVWDEKYTLVRQLSRKQSKRFGETYLLKNKTSKEQVVFKSTEKTNSIGIQQLKNEKKFNFDQKGLPIIISNFENETHLGFYKKFDEGQTIDQYWKTVKKSKRKEKLKEIVDRLAPLFEKLTEQKIVHADIKPENIIVNETEGRITCSLIDFGLAFRTDDLPERKTLFQLGYAPPELILNRLECADNSTDIFSFCLVIYKLWAGKLPISSPHPAMMTQLQITYPIEKTWKIPKSLWKVLEKGLVKHHFKLPANKMAKQDVQEVLRKANLTRYQSFIEFQKGMIEF